MNPMESKTQTKRTIIEHSLRERVKELNCLYGIADLIERSGSSVDNILQGTVNLLPASWQYPEITYARISYTDKVYTTPLFSESEWSQVSLLMEEGEAVGKIEVFYIKEMPPSDEGPFLVEERKMLVAISKSISKALERIQRIKRLENKTSLLEEENKTIKNELKKLKAFQSEFNSSIESNIDAIIIPLISHLKTTIPDKQDMISVLEDNLKKIVSPYLFLLSRDKPKLTKAELQIVKMTKEGLSTSEIAQIRNVAISTVHRQREKIRMKIGLRNKRVGLTTYLRSMKD